MAFAQVTNGVVVSVSPGKLSSASIPCGSIVAEGWLFDGSTFTPPPVSDPAPSAPVARLMTPQDMAQQVLSQGLSVTSASYPALNGTYSTSLSSQASLNAVVTYVLLNGVFPGGTATYLWVDEGGSTHLFPGIAEFKAFATSFADFISAATLYGNSAGKLGSLPSNQISIA